MADTKAKLGALAVVVAIGVATMGAGMGTYALLSDEERSEIGFEAGSWITTSANTPTPTLEPLDAPTTEQDETTTSTANTPTPTSEAGNTPTPTKTPTPTPTPTDSTTVAAPTSTTTEP